MLKRQRSRVFVAFGGALAALGLSGASLVAGAAPAGAEGSWAATGALNQPRITQTATLLDRSRVLVAGGRDNAGAITSAELYNPITEKFRFTGSMVTSRWSHTAVLLPDGKVLVAGGFTGFVPSSNAQAVTETAELYDPATGRWAPTGSMPTRRALHSMALLPDGKVLAAGGRTCSGPAPLACDFTFRTDAAEIYDPVTGVWTPTGTMNAPRHTTSATVLKDGRVLVPAGFSGADPHDTDLTADVYDPAAGTWSLTGNLNRSRARQGAMTLPNGMVLIGPGSRATTCGPPVCQNGGPPFSAVINDTTEVYDPAADTWTTTANPLLPGRFNFQYAVLPNGKALVAGGFGGPAGGEAAALSAEVYDPATGMWATAGTTTHLHSSSSALANSRTAVVLSANPRTFEFGGSCGDSCGKVLVVGDSLTDPVADLYTPTAPVPTSREQCKNRGFRGLTNAEGRPFQDQLQCVRYVDRNVAA